MTPVSGPEPAPRREVADDAAPTPAVTTAPAAAARPDPVPPVTRSPGAATSYGTGVRRGSLAGLALGVLLVLAAYGLAVPTGMRSVALGAGLVALSSAATVLVAAQMYRVAPAATAPALAALYLLKVLVLGWLLLAVGAPVWLVPRAFAVTVLVGLLLATAVFALLASRVTAGAAPQTEHASEHEQPPAAQRLSERGTGPGADPVAARRGTRTSNDDESETS